MKRARKSLHQLLKPRNPLVTVALQKKAGAHQRKDKRADRARQREQLRRQLRAEKDAEGS